MTTNLELQSSLDEAIEKTRLEDFGNDTFLEGLKALLISCQNESRLNSLGIQIIHSMVLRCLINRLQVQDWITRHSEILNEKIEKPLIITGLPRTGSTFLQVLLSIDPANRALRRWEANRPCPPPELVFSATDSRIQAMHKQIQITDQIKPGLQAIHPMDAGGFAQCMVLLSNEFKSAEFTLTIWAPAYDEWYYNCDMTSAYAYHKMLLQLLQWRLPNENWVLKNPPHLPWLDSLIGQYPDAQIVFTHRDPLKVLASASSLASTVFSIGSDPIDAKEIADYYLKILAVEMDKAMEKRESLNPESFYDLQYRDLIVDPIGAVKRIYEYFGRRVSRGHERRMQVWIRDNPSGKRGRHHYTVEDFGLNPVAVRNRFGDYQERFGVLLES
jgi:hypothetical protein